MGTFAMGSVNIYLKSMEDADKVHEMISNIEEIVEKEQGPCDFGVYDLSENNTSHTEVCFNFSSSRTQNAQWQLEQFADQLKKMVQRKEIQAPDEFNSDIYIAGDAIYMTEDEFLEDED
jgi:hypothetical protein